MFLLLISDFTFLGQWWSGSDCTIHLEKPEDYAHLGQEHIVVLMNHKYDIDWLMAWILSERLSMLGVSHICYACIWVSIFMCFFLWLYIGIFVVVTIEFPF